MMEFDLMREYLLSFDPANDDRRGLTINDLGWSREQAAIVRGMFGAMADDWDDPAMDVYDGDIGEGID